MDNYLQSQLAAIRQAEPSPESQKKSAGDAEAYKAAHAQVLELKVTPLDAFSIQLLTKVQQNKLEKSTKDREAEKSRLVTELSALKESSKVKAMKDLETQLTEVERLRQAADAQLDEASRWMKEFSEQVAVGSRSAGFGQKMRDLKKTMPQVDGNL